VGGGALDTRRGEVVNAAMPSPTRRLRFMLALLTALASPACAPSGAALTPKELDAHGVMSFKAPPEKVFKAALEALKVLGYEIAVEQPDKGLIVTKHRLVRDVAVGTSARTAVEVAYSRQYTIEIKGNAAGSRVIATPALFENADDISAKPVWDLESAGGEHELWKQLFAKIEQFN
jgi:hypothetical protein